MLFPPNFPKIRNNVNEKSAIVQKNLLCVLFCNREYYPAGNYCILYPDSESIGVQRLNAHCNKL